MNLEFDLEKIILTEFGIGLEENGPQTYVAVQVDSHVQDALKEMVKTTWKTMQEMDNIDGIQRYEPSEKYSETEHLYLPLKDDMVSSLRNLHLAHTLNVDTAALSDPTIVFCYFARLTDAKGQKITALRRATQFKGILKSRNRLVRILDDTLKIIKEDVFKLDNDFDLLVDGNNVHILRPSGFEFAGKLQEAILEAVPRNISIIAKDLPFIAFDRIEDYCRKHPRAARYLASIKAQQETKNINRALLKKMCAKTGVKIRDLKGKLTVVEGHEIGFLELLDRRRYVLELIRGSPERFKAASRRKLNG